MRARTTAAALLVVCWSLAGASQESVDLGVVDRIKTEAFARSEVMEHLRNLTDVYGPRLTGSREFDRAASWATERLTTANRPERLPRRELPKPSSVTTKVPGAGR